jgi:hypothetical protein
VHEEALELIREVGRQAVELAEEARVHEAGEEGEGAEEVAVDDEEGDGVRHALEELRALVADDVRLEDVDDELLVELDRAPRRRRDDDRALHVLLDRGELLRPRPERLRGEQRRRGGAGGGGVADERGVRDERGELGEVGVRLAQGELRVDEEAQLVREAAEVDHVLPR